LGGEGAGALNEAGKPLKCSQVLGVAYREDVEDIRESPALDITQLLSAKGALVSYHDPHVLRIPNDGYQLTKVPDLYGALAAGDCVVIVIDHSSYNWPAILSQARSVVDTRHVREPSA
jgi:UDP-N-acetyl-D-glucosamine dehydrogenase